MTSRKAPADLEELLDRFEEAAKKGPRVSLDRIMDEVGRRSFGPLLLVAGLLMVAPVIGDIPGVPALLGAFVLLISVQLIFGHDHFWLPQWLLRRSVKSEKLLKVCQKWFRRPARGIDRLLRHRLPIFVNGAGGMAIAFAAALLALATPITELVPFSANGVGAAIAIFGLALTAHDGFVAAIGWVVVALIVAILFKALP